MILSERRVGNEVEVKDRYFISILEAIVFCKIKTDHPG
jgi:hypothetical protein